MSNQKISKKELHRFFKETETNPNLVYKGSLESLNVYIMSNYTCNGLDDLRDYFYRDGRKALTMKKIKEIYTKCFEETFEMELENKKRAIVHKDVLSKVKNTHIPIWIENYFEEIMLEEINPSFDVKYMKGANSLLRQIPTFEMDLDEIYSILLVHDIKVYKEYQKTKNRIKSK